MRLEGRGGAETVLERKGEGDYRGKVERERDEEGKEGGQKTNMVGKKQLIRKEQCTVPT